MLVSTGCQTTTGIQPKQRTVVTGRGLHSGSCLKGPACAGPQRCKQAGARGSKPAAPGAGRCLSPLPSSVSAGAPPCSSSTCKAGPLELLPCCRQRCQLACCHCYLCCMQRRQAQQATVTPAWPGQPCPLLEACHPLGRAPSQLRALTTARRSRGGLHALHSGGCGRQQGGLTATAG